MSAIPTRPLRRNLLISFTLPTLVLGLMHGPQGQIQAIYAKHAGLPLTALATAMLIVKMFDSLTYPLIGYLSDRTYARRGSRKTWVIAGTILSVIGMWNLLRPSQAPDIVYFGIWMTVTYFGWKIAEIPLQAWSYGLTTDYAQRARVQTWRALATFVGQLLFFAIPFIAMKLGYSDSTELDFRSLGVAAVVCAVALPLATLIVVTRVHDGVAAPIASKPAPAIRRHSVAELVDAIRKNSHLLQLLAAFLPFNLLGGLISGVAYLYVDSYLHLGRQYPGIMALALVTSLAGIPFWSAMSSRFERHRVWAISQLICGASCAALAFAAPGPVALPIAYLLYPIMLFSFSGSVIVFAMSADIVDYGRLVTGDNHAGLYGSIFSFLQKSVQGLSSAAGLAIAGFCGFDAAAATQSDGGVIGIKLSGALLPAVGLIGSAIIIWNYSLTRARIEQVQAQLKLTEA